MGGEAGGNKSDKEPNNMAIGIRCDFESRL